MKKSKTKKITEKKPKRSKQEETKTRDGGMEGIGEILLKYNIDDSKKRRYISKEFQDFGYRLALELDDIKNAGMYMKIAKNTDRSVLEGALSFVKDAKNVRNKSRLFLWKMKKIREAI